MGRGQPPSHVPATMESPEQYAGLSSVMHFAWFSRIYFKTRIHARIEQFVSFVTHFPISKQIFETEFEHQENIKFPNEHYIVPSYTHVPFAHVIPVSFVLQTKVMGFGHSWFYVLDLSSIFYYKRAKIESIRVSDF